VQKRVDALNKRIGELQRSFSLLDPQNPQGAGTRAELEQSRAERADAETTLSSLDQQIGNADLAATVGKASMRVIGPAILPSAALPPTPVQWVAAGAGLGILVGVLGVVTGRLADRRLRRRADIAAALGTAVLGVVDARALTGPPGDTSDARSRSWRDRVRGLVRPDEPAPLDHEDQLLEDLRYRRAFTRLVTGLPRPVELLIVVLDNDPTAGRAVARLAVAGADRPVLLLDKPGRVSATVEAFARARALPAGQLTVLSEEGDGASSFDVATVLRVETMSVARPVIPVGGDPARVLVVVSAGAATGQELFTVAQACREAGSPAEWAVIVGDADDDEPEPEPPELSLPVRDQGPPRVTDEPGAVAGHRPAYGRRQMASLALAVARPAWSRVRAGRDDPQAPYADSRDPRPDSAHR
jgi:hypothetical protein